jgi:hypothetical protein
VAPSPTKKQSRASPAKKKRKAQQNVVESKPSVGVHGPDLFLQARLAAEVGHRNLVMFTYCLRNLIGKQQSNRYFLWFSYEGGVFLMCGIH